MPEGGRITIGTRGQVNVNGKLFVELTITDTGPGIPDHIMRNLFHPVESSKGKAHSGLGLTIVKKLVTDCGGAISCSSSRKGTEFRVLLPADRKNR
jgi:nitrogen-specific signal transduction histidine kinase